MRSLSVVAVALVVVVSASAQSRKGNTSLNIDVPVKGGQSSTWIEQQDDWPRPDDGGIVNPLAGCVWSVNDHYTIRKTGSLNAAASTSDTTCLVSDFNPVLATRFGFTDSWQMSDYGMFGVMVTAPTSGLSVAVCYQPQGRCFAPMSVQAGTKSWRTTFCGRANYRPDDPVLQDIAGSNGGRGVVGSVTLTITNTTGRQVRDITVQWGVSSDVFWPSACEGRINGPADHTEYPFEWSGG